MTPPDSAYFEEIQGRLRGLLIAVEDQLPVGTADLLGEMIDANECGIALETMGAVLVESSASLTRYELDVVEDLARTMGLELVNVEQLRSLVVPDRENASCDGENGRRSN